MDCLNKKQGLSIIIYANKAHNYIEECLNSINFQKSLLNYEYEILIGVDTCKDTCNKLNSIKHKYKNLKIFLSENNIGVWLMKNSLVSKSQYDTLCFFNAEDLMINDFFKTNLSSLSNNNFIRVGCKKFNNPDKTKLSNFINTDDIICIKTSTFLQLNGYSNWKSVSDYDLINRLVSNNFKQIDILETTVLKRVFNENLSINLFNNKEVLASKINYINSKRGKSKYSFIFETSNLKSFYCNSNIIDDNIKIKVGAAYNTFYGLELIEESIRSIKNVVDYIVLVHQQIGFSGKEEPSINKSIIKKLIDEKLIDEIVYYNQKEENSKQQSVLEKRNLGLECCKKNNCHYIMPLDTDELYNADELKNEIKFMYYNDIDTLYCPIRSYYYDRNHYFDDSYFVASIYKINNRKFEATHSSVLVDPNRKMKENNYHISNMYMHHYTYLKESYDNKIDFRSYMSINNEEIYNNITKIKNHLLNWKENKDALVHQNNTKGGLILSYVKLNKTKPKTYIYYHIGAYDNLCTSIVKDQLHLLQVTGLYNYVDKIYYSIVGDKSFLPQLPSKFECIYENTDYTVAELPILRKLKEHSLKEEFKCLYFHTKGSFGNLHNYSRVHWRRYLEYFNIEKWKKNIELLNEYDTVGSNYIKGKDWYNNHYSGNFWWTSSDYLKKLEVIDNIQIIRPGVNNTDRYKAEMWLLSNDKAKFYNWNTIGCSGKDEDFKSLDYRDIGNIYYSIPYDINKNIGKYYNDFMKVLPNDNDYACFVDADTIFTTTDYGHIIQQIIIENPNVGVFTSVTNRIGCKWQLTPETNWDNDDMTYHRKLGRKLQDELGTQCEDKSNVGAKEPFSGILILVKKSTWKKVGGFLEEGMLGVDNDFSRKLQNFNEKIFLMKGIYLYHWYRGGNSSDSKHLLK